MRRLIFLARSALSAGGAGTALILLGIMFTIYAWREPSALSVLELRNLLNDTVVLAVAASGLTLVVLCGELDLSGASIVGLANVIVASTSTGPFGPLGSLLSVLALGAAVGAANGALVAYLKQQSLAVTLGSLIVCQGLALLILSAPGGDVAPAIIDVVSGTVLEVPVAAIVLAMTLLVWLLLKRLPIGIRLHAAGADAQACHLSGVDVPATKLFAFIAAGLCYALAGFIHSAEIGSGDPRVSGSFLLFMFAAVAIGGTALNGGRGGIAGTLAGASILTVLQKMLFALNIADFYTYVLSGIIMVFAMLFGQASALLGEAIQRRQA
jgi:ribose transport system permease protein